LGGTVLLWPSVNLGISGGALVRSIQNTRLSVVNTVIGKAVYVIELSAPPRSYLLYGVPRLSLNFIL